ncbi:MAG: DUF4389 domain-containing protein [Planctomycetales bacterium]|nr:DUF4389 domain-containing protein [Planctomycetales bacterium]
MSQDTPDGTTIPRGETVERVLMTVLYALILNLVAGLLAFVVIFQLLLALITMQPPLERITRFAGKVNRYLLEMVQYMTYNSDCPPFPFRDLPSGNGSTTDYGTAG